MNSIVKVLPVAEKASAAGWVVQRRYKDYREWGRWDVVVMGDGDDRRRLEFDTEVEATAAFLMAVEETEKMFAAAAAEDEHEARPKTGRKKTAAKKELSPIQFRLVHLFTDKVVQHVEIQMPPKKKFVYRSPVHVIELKFPLVVLLARDINTDDEDDEISEHDQREREFPVGQRFSAIRNGGAYIAHYHQDGEEKYFAISQSHVNVLERDPDFAVVATSEAKAVAPRDTDEDGENCGKDDPDADDYDSDED